jgi:hypothetical protein
MQACAFPVPPALGDPLEVEHTWGLWDTRVLGVSSNGAYHVAKPGDGTALEVTLDQLRPSLRWDWETGAWHWVQQQAWLNKQAAASAALADKEAGPAELAVLAFCSLAASVVQVVRAQPDKMGEASVRDLLALAADLVQAASVSSTSSRCGGGGGNNPGGTASTCIPSGGASSSSGGGRWGLAASLAAAVAAGAYNAHYQQLQGTGAAAHAQEMCGSAPAGKEADAKHRSKEAGAAGSSKSAACSAGGSCSSAANPNSSNSSAAAAGCDATRSCKPEGVIACAQGEGCDTCSSAAQLYMAMCFLERGMVSPPTTQVSATAGVALLVEAAQQQGTSLQQHLQQLLLALAWHHPVPSVCGNVLCGRLEGPAAVGAVRGRLRTLCGGCEAAWYCCEACQSAAWPVHSKVCKGTKAGAVSSCSAGGLMVQPAPAARTGEAAGHSATGSQAVGGMELPELPADVMSEEYVESSLGELLSFDSFGSLNPYQNLNPQDVTHDMFDME